MFEEDSEPPRDFSEYALVNSIEVMFDTCAWRVPEVRVLKTPQGMPLAFVAITKLHNIAKERIGLPIEFFNHQLLDLDYKNPSKFAKFMSEYGFIGPTFYAYEKSEKLSEALSELDPYNREAVFEFERKFGYMPKAYLSCFNLDWHDIGLHYAELKSAFSEIESKLSAAQDGKTILNELKIRGLVSIERAQYLFEDWLYCVKHVQAMVRYKTPQELSEALEENEESVIRNCIGAQKILQRHLEGVRPRIDILNVTENEYITGRTDHPQGSFEQALALQIWNFILESKNGFTICKECGKAFVHKQTKSKKAQSRSTSVFCCDRCKNRYAQREHRKTEGYRLKQSRKSLKA